MYISDVDFLNKIKKRDSTFFMDGKSVEDVLFCSNKPKVSVAVALRHMKITLSEKKKG